MSGVTELWHGPDALGGDATLTACVDGGDYYHLGIQHTDRFMDWVSLSREQIVDLAIRLLTLVPAKNAQTSEAGEGVPTS